MMEVTMKKQLIMHLLMAAALCFPAAMLHAQPRPVTEIDTPTAFTIGKGAYQVGLLAYDSGGIELKAAVGLHDMIFLGASFDIENLIGKETPKPNIPGVIIRFKFTDGPERWPISIALGYDSFYCGREGRRTVGTDSYNEVTYGPYLVFTKPVYILDYEQYISFGLRLPVQPYFDENDISYFLSFDVPLGRFFTIKAEMERVFWNFSRFNQWLFNFGVRFTYLEQLAFEFDIMVQPGEPVPNRILKVEYLGAF